ncbi:Blue-light-activated protein [Enhygromyxa salina]|uniref:histidine kinase n=1 Tax=Enhygromyxa salina TaxID=215803 RepID=A0A2S9YYC8_9BACT|nr:Blue-light-activated protein [Enhygromyxa salina]
MHADGDPATLYEELQVHHIELQLQNEELRSTQQELERSHDRYRKLYDEAPVGYLTLGRGSTIEAANLTAATLLGVDRAALIGTPLSRRMHQASADLLHAHLQHVIQDGQRHACELGIHRADGKLVWMRLDSVPDDDDDDDDDEDDDGEPGSRGPSCHTALTDVSQRRELQAHVQRAEQIEVIGRLASGVAHEFNNLLMAMLGCATSALLEIDEQTRAGQLLRDLKSEAIRGATLTRQLLALGRLGDDTNSVVDINAIVAQNARILRHTLPEDICLAFKLGASDGRVWAKQGQIEQMLVNLVLNARDAVSGGGSVKVSTGEITLDDARARALRLEPGTYATITVMDTGVGMDAETKAHLFEPFFTTKAVGEGTGLGMSTVYGVVQQVGGQIEVKSELGVGTTVRVYLPRTTRPLSSPTERSQAALLGGDETVLVVEDEALVRQTVRNYLERWGYRVLEAGDGAEALDLLRARPDIDLLVTDMVLPRSSGSELVREAAGLRPQLRVLFMSAYPKVKLIRERQLDREAPTLQKPFTEDTLLTKVREVLGSGPEQATLRGPAGEMVLLVEDDELAREAMELLLEDEGYQVLAAGDGSQALALAGEHGEAIDVVVSDLGLPNTSSREMLEQLQTLVRPRAIVILSGRSSADAEVVQLLQVMTAKSTYLEKPIEIEQLVAAIQRMLAS